MKLTDLINEEKYTIIDPKGNPAGTGTKMQANQRQKKLGGSKKGYFVVPANKSLKARRTLEKYKFDFKNPKLQDLMSDLYFESVNEGRAFVQAARKAKEEGKTEFEFNGKTYPVTLKESEIKLKDIFNESSIINEAKLLPKGTKVIITHPKFKGDRGIIIGTGLTNGDYQVQTNGKIKGIEPKYLKVDKPDTKKEERNLKNLAGVIKIDLSEALEMLEEGGVLEAIDHLEIAVERLQDMIKDLKRKK